MKRVVATVALALLLATAHASAQTPSLDAILARTAAYVADFVGRFSNVVAEETYRQQFQRLPNRPVYVSDYLLVRYPGAQTTWLIFRDVREINGRAVREQQDRLTKLFLQPWEDAEARAQQITQETARYFGSWSNPLLVIAFLQSHYQPRFRFSLGAQARELGASVVEVKFKEEQTPTILQSMWNGRLQNIFTTGSAWIDAATGRVVKTKIIVGRAPWSTIVETRFRFDERLQADVPAEMKESSITAREGEINAVATYSQFRRFTVRTTETIETPATPR